mgnify:CR=1 FL=1
MQKKDCFLVGTVFKLHGYKGDVNIYNDHGILFDLNTIKYFLIEQNNILVPFFIQKIRYKKANIILTKFEEINSEKEALNILKKKVYLPNELLPKINKKSTAKELLGFKVIDKILGELGKISYINSQTTQKLIYVRKNEQEFCFPMHENFIINVNTKKRIMEVNIPKDLINLN